MSKSFKKTESTIFTDKRNDVPDKKPVSKGKLAMRIVAILLIVLVVIPFIIVKCNDNQGSSDKYIAPLSERIKNTTADQTATALFGLKGTKFEDFNAENEILSLLNIDDYCGKYELTTTIKDNKNRIVFTFEKEHNSSIAEWFENTMIKYSCMILALIPNADEVQWAYKEKPDADEKYFTKADARKLLNNQDVTAYAVSDKGIQLLMNELGLNE